MSDSESLPDAISLDRSEELDREDLDDLDYPPEHPMGVNRFGTTPLEEEARDTVEGRTSREEPEVSPADIDPRDAEEGYVFGPASAVDGFSAEGDDVDSWRAGTQRDPYYEDTTDREAPIPAEEAALHIEDGLA
jgi:hypothetical protein